MDPRSSSRSAAPRLPAASLALALAIALSGCYRPQVVAGREPGPGLARLAGAADAWPSVAGLVLHVFNTGMNRVSPLLVGSPAPWRPVPAFVLAHPTRGLVVFDCGLGPAVAERGEKTLHPLTRLLFQTRSLPGKDLPAEMRAAGLRPEAVTTVVLSHLHFDHVGGAPAFRNARFVVGAGEREAAGSRLNGFDPAKTAWVAENAWQTVDFAKGVPFATFPRAVDLFGDGSLVLVPGGGHTPGGIGAFAGLPGGPVFLAGDLAVHFDWLASDDVQRIVSDPERAADVRNRIRALRARAPEVVIVPGHDLRGLPSGRSDLVLHDSGLFSAAPWPIDADGVRAAADES